MYSYISRPDMVELREEYGKWLLGVFGSSSVLTMGTFTLRNPDTKLSSWTKPGRQFVVRAGQKLHDMLLDNGFSAFVCVEEGTDTRRLHLHSLSNMDFQRMKIVEMWWRRKYGHVALRNVRSKKGVALYVTKYVTKSDLLFYAGGPAFTPVKEQAVETDLRLDSLSDP